MTTTTFNTLNDLLTTVKEMDAKDFLLEFDSIVEIDEMENLLDANEGMVNIIAKVKDGKKTKSIAILFIDGKFDSYSY